MLTWANLFQTVQSDLMKWFIQFTKKKNDSFVNWTSVDVTGDSHVLPHALHNYKPKV